jgi:hypothetical protein
MSTKPRPSRNLTKKRRQIAGVRRGPAPSSTFYVPRGMNFIPRREFVTVRQEMNGYYTIGTLQPLGVTAIMGNNFDQPFNTATNAIGTTGASKSNITVTTGYNVTDHPYGWTELNTLYQYFKVHKMRLTVSIQPTAITDVVQAQLAPNTYPSNLFIAQMSSNPKAKTKLCLCNEKNVLSVTVDVADLLGYTREQYQGLTPTLMSGSVAASQQAFFNFQWQNLVDGNPSSAIAFTFLLEEWLEVSELQEFTS